jgi:uncharacterized surface protein with fasciclin (FAS1) repeats
MTSCGPNSDFLNFTHMFDKTDLRGPLPIQKPCANSLLSIIENTPDFSLFLYMVRIAKLQDFLNLLQANFTIFIPSNKELLKHINQNYFINMDPNTAWSIVKSSIIKYRLPSEILEDSPSSFFYTYDDYSSRLFITNISGKTYINNSIKVIKKDILANNGIIHIIDGLIVPNII